MRLNRENTLIENNLYPCAGMHPKDVQSKLLKILKPYENDILNLESALLLHNIPLLAAFGGYLVGFFILSNILINSFVSSLAYGIIFVPLFHLFYCLGGVQFGRKLYKPLPNLSAEDPLRIRPLEELLTWFWCPILWGWRVGFFVYRTFVCPNVVDTALIIVAIILLNLIFKVINAFILIIILLVLSLAAPAILTQTPAGDYAAKFLEDMKKGKEKKGESQPASTPAPSRPAPAPAQPAPAAETPAQPAAETPAQPAAAVEQPKPE